MNCVIELFRHHPLFCSLSEEEWQGLAVLFPPPVTVAPGEPLLPTGEAALLMLISGQATVQTAGHGKCAVMRTLGPGDLCGVATLFGNTAPVSDMVAITTCRVVRCPRALVHQFLQESFTFTESYIAFLTDRIRFLNRRIANYTEDSANERVLYYIREHLDERGEFIPAGSMTELARTLHVGRSSLYRAFEHLIEQGYLEEIATKRWKYKEELFL